MKINILTAASEAFEESLLLKELPPPQNLFHRNLGINAAYIATQKYDQTRMISDYLSYYEEVLDDWK